MTIQKLLAILMSLTWIVGFGMGFIIPANSNYIWLPDALLLLGFWPLLLKLRAKWLWLTFGVLNFFIGLILQLIPFLPDQDFARIPNAITVKRHLSEHHVPLVWMFIGLLSAAVGISVLCFCLAKRLIGKKKIRQ